MDSLAIYKEIDIVSAKPTIQERAGVKHFGIDVINPNENFSVDYFIKIYQQLVKQAKEQKRPIIIVGGTSFYLKMLIDGLSQLPKISKRSQNRVKDSMLNLKDSYDMLSSIDSDFMSSIASSDRYRIEKALEIYFETNLTPSEYFKANPPKPIIKSNLPIYEIITQKDNLREKIAQRTQNMINDGLIDEIAYLEKKYGRKPNAMKSIGIKETLNYLDGVYNRDIMREKIIINTARLAKRQKTFNSSQFKNKTLIEVKELRELF